MFELNFDKIDRDSFSMRYIALTNLFAAWYMLLNLKTPLPSIDATLARIYFTEYGMPVDDLNDLSVAKLASEYSKQIQNFFFKCEVQRCENIIDRFGKVGCDNRLPHGMTLPSQCKQFFLEILAINRNSKTNNMTTSETQCLDSLLSSLQVNNIYEVTSNRQGMIQGSLQKDYNITPEQFSSYTDIIHNAVIDLYRPLNALDETYEDWGTKFRKVIDYIKTLVFMTTRDVAFNKSEFYVSSYGEESEDRQLAFGVPMVDLGIKDDIYKNAVKTFKRAYYSSKLIDQIQSVVAPYSSLNIEHAICLFHNTNARLNTSKLPQIRNSEAFKFLVCQELICNLDEKIRSQMLSRATADVPAEP